MTAKAEGAKSPKPFVFAREDGSHAAEINDFYNDFMGLERSLDAYRWEFQECLEPPSFQYTITERASERIVGHHAVIPTPLVRRGESLSGGRTENTIVHPSVRTKVFYPAMEKRALAEISERLPIIHTIHSKGPRRLRERLGYRSAGRWVVYLPKAGGDYLASLVQRAQKGLSLPLPNALVHLAARVAGASHSAWTGVRAAVPAGAEVAEIGGLAEIADEYAAMWQRARRSYDLTIDRTPEFLDWRISRNPHLDYRIWTVRRGGELAGIVIAHWHRIGSSAALFVDDLIAADYTEEGFDLLVRCLRGLDDTADSIFAMTLAVDTPLHAVLRRRYPMQARLHDRFGPRLFDDMMAYDRTGKTDGDTWFVTGIFTEGMDTSRSETGERIA
jgi:hypothetical protein